MNSWLEQFIPDRNAVADRLRRRSSGVIAAVLLTLAAAVAVIVSLSGDASVGIVR